MLDLVEQRIALIALRALNRNHVAVESTQVHPPLYMNQSAVHGSRGIWAESTSRFAVKPVRFAVIRRHDVRHVAVRGEASRFVF